MSKALSNLDLKCPNCDYALTGLATRTCPECGFNFDPTVLKWRSRHAGRRRWLVSLMVMAFALYAPFSWLLWGDNIWSDSQHLLWLALWPILPGLPATFLLRHFMQPQWPQWAELVAMGVFTVLLLLLLTWLGTRGKRWLIITAIIVLALSCYNGWVGYMLFRM